MSAGKATLLCVVAAVAILFVVVAESACPNGCSNHGTCQQDRCQCTSPWAGVDCSYQSQEVTSGQVYDHTTPPLPTFAWAYYHAVINHESDLIFNVNQTNNGDCDLYIQRDQFPTRSNWFRRDIGTSRESTIVIEKAGAGVWYAGVYGFIECAFKFKLTIAGYNPCPKNCSNHGICGVDGKCTCSSGWSGPACDEMPYLAPGRPVTDSVMQGEWKYYHTNVTTVPTVLSYLLNQTSAGDVDLYINKNAVPTVFQYIASNTTLHDESLIIYEATEAGVYYAGVLGFWASNNPGSLISYTLSLSTPGSSCQVTSQCSGPSHGTCNGNKCNCKSGFSGNECETKTAALQMGTNYTGYVADGLWNYYNFIGVSNREVAIHVWQNSGAAGDCDIYVRANSIPTLTTYDYAEVSQENNFVLYIDNPLQSTWHIGMYGWSACSYTLSIANRADTNCGGHGTFDSNLDACVCNSGWAGEDCTIPVTPLTNGVVVNGTVAFQQWAYFTIQVFDAHSLEVRLKETTQNEGVPGAVWLYLNADGFPSLHVYDESDTSTSSYVHTVAYTVRTSLAGTYFIGVYGSPYGHRGNTNSFSLVAWHPDF